MLYRRLYVCDAVVETAVDFRPEGAQRDAMEGDRGHRAVPNDTDSWTLAAPPDALLMPCNGLGCCGRSPLGRRDSSLRRSFLIQGTMSALKVNYRRGDVKGEFRRGSGKLHRRGSGQISRGKATWIPACAGMTGEDAGMTRGRGREWREEGGSDGGWIPACAGMT